MAAVAGKGGGAMMPGTGYDRVDGAATEAGPAGDVL